AAFGFVAALVRPEGAIASMLVAAALVLGPQAPGSWPTIRRDRRALWALLPAVGPFVVPLLHLALARHARSSTAIVKWLPSNPYLSRAALFDTIVGNVKLLLSNLIDGEEWTRVFLPENTRYPFLLGAFALPLTAYKRRLPLHGAAVAIVVLGT